MMKKFLLPMILLSVSFDNNAMSGKFVGMMTREKDSSIATAFIVYTGSLTVAALVGVYKYHSSWKHNTHTQSDVDNACQVSMNSNPSNFIDMYHGSDNKEIVKDRKLFEIYYCKKGGSEVAQLINQGLSNNEHNGFAKTSREIVDEVASKHKKDLEALRASIKSQS